MATMAIRPVFPLHPRSSGSKHSSTHRTRNPARRRLWQTLFIAAGATALSVFSIVAPILDDPRGHLAALDVSSLVLPLQLLGPESAFEFTPTMLGPAISGELLATLDIEEWLEMPELEVHALPPSGDAETASDG
jgi:hypothetical protein